ncbi:MULTISPECIES: lipase secretion chaperone [Cupriavidus]
MRAFERRGPAWWWLALPGCVLGGAVYWMTMPPAPVPGAAPVAVSAAPGRPRDAMPVAAAASGAALLPSLAGVDVPAGLATDAHGNLRASRALRGYFDYYLSAAHDAGDAAVLDAIVRGDIRARVPEPAATQAWQLWQRYRAYLAEVHAGAARDAGPLPETQAAEMVQTAEVAQVARLRALWDARRAARQRHLPDVAALWFGEEEAYDAAMLERLEVATQPGLDAAQRRQRLAALDSRLPDDARAARADSARPQQIGETIGRLQAEGRGAQDIAEALAQSHGAEVAQRYRLQAQADQSWQDRYRDYARQRAQLAQFPGLSEADRQQQLAQLRAQMFSDPGEALRAYAHDRASQEQAAAP